MEPHFKFNHSIKELLYLNTPFENNYVYGPMTYESHIKASTARDIAQQMKDLEIKYKHDIDLLKTNKEFCLDCTTKVATGICTECGIRVCSDHIFYGQADLRYYQEYNVLCRECQRIADVDYHNQLFGDTLGIKNDTVACYGL